MARHRIVAPVAPPKQLRKPAEEVRRQERADHVERSATMLLVANVPIKEALVRLRKSPEHGGVDATKPEAVEALRRAEQVLKQAMAEGSLTDRAASYRRLLNVARKLYLALENTDSKKVHSIRGLALAINQIETRLAKMAGWDEPERMHVVVQAPRESARQAFEQFSDAEYEQLAAEYEEQARLVLATRRGLLPAPTQ